MTMGKELKERTVDTIVENLAAREKDVRAVALRANPIKSPATSNSAMTAQVGKQVRRGTSDLAGALRVT